MCLTVLGGNVYLDLVVSHGKCAVALNGNGREVVGRRGVDFDRRYGSFNNGIVFCDMRIEIRRQCNGPQIQKRKGCILGYGLIDYEGNTALDCILDFFLLGIKEPARALDRKIRRIGR